jgi:hypothetical protein
MSAPGQSRHYASIILIDTSKLDLIFRKYYFKRLAQGFGAGIGQKSKEADGKCLVVDHPKTTPLPTLMVCQYRATALHCRTGGV